MRKIRRNKKIGVRVAAAVLALAIIAPMPGIFRTTAAAATSLSGIEQIKNRGSFSILEIVPQEGTGSIGYYIGGQEPTANWLDELAAKVGKSERKAYADQLLADLKATGLMGETGASATTYPLVQTDEYAEYLPWETLPENYEEVRLKQAEEAKVVGTFVEDESGDYVEANTYVYDTAGTYVENAEYYAFGERGGGTGTDIAYYYQIAFTRANITEENVASYIGVPLYTPATDVVTPYYDYAGTLAEGGDFTIDDDINAGAGYYTAAVVYGDGSAPYLTTNWEYLQEVTLNAETIPGLEGTTVYYMNGEEYAAVTITAEFVPVEGTVYYKMMDNAHSYFAIKDYDEPYRLAQSGERGSFKQIVGYKYVGNGNAAVGTKYYTFTVGAGTGSREHNIVYSSIYITGGYTNNEWFKRYVLDIDEESQLESFDILVDSVTVDALTETRIQRANLVVISAGFDLGNGGSVVAYPTDVNNAFLDDLSAKARVVDTRLTVTGSAGSSKLLQLQDGGAAPAVTANNVYNFAVGTVGTADARDALATNKFHTPFTNITPYQVVADEIEYENFLPGRVDKLSEEISMATCIRYIINTHRIQNKKTSLSVLDIQSAAKYDGASGPLTVATVKSWLPKATQDLIGDNISITHMSTAALVGKIEDLSEQYDLIYIGANERNTYLPGNYYYSNIGSEKGVNENLRGLLDRNEGTARYSGNDLTPKKKTELLEFANAGLPIVVSDSLVSNGTSSSTHTLQATVSGSGNVLTASYTISPALADGVTVSAVKYVWEYRSEYGSNWHPASDYDGNDTTLTLTENNKNHYRCTVTVTVNESNYSSRSNAVQRNSTGGGGGGAQYQVFEKKDSGDYRYWYNSNDKSFVGENVQQDAANRKLTVLYRNKGREVKEVNYKWYRVNNNGSTTEMPDSNSSTYTVPENDVYYFCRIEIDYYSQNNGGGHGGEHGGGNTEVRHATCISPAYRLRVYGGGGSGSSGGNSFNTTAQGYSASIPGALSGGGRLDENKVDPNSMMYGVLNSVWNYDNVMIQSDLQASATNTSLDDNQDTLVKYLNLSRPSISITSKPTEYGGDFTKLANYDCGGALNFTFTINNPTDPTPVQTRYLCNVYIDQNGDGRHSEEERIGDNYIGQVSGSNSTAVDNGALMANTTYTLQRSLNRNQFSGIVAWKLEVIKVGDSTVHASEKGYAYIQPATPTVVNVLQVRSKNGEGTNLATNSEFTPLYTQVKNANMYDIKVNITTVNTLNDKNSKEAVFAELDQYDMIILGFDDMYGNLNNRVAQAVVDYIDTGKAVLFTHDTTSFHNQDTNGWGYQFNQVVRDKVGLDRYGVTNDSFENVVAYGSDGQVNTAKAAEIRAAGYTVAYVPGPTVTSAGETQGYTNTTIDRYSGSGSSDGGTKTTTKVSQVNRGQITEYPYKLDIEMDISTTHDQYYQLNMNADDIVVWYCLAGDKYANYKNDGTNAYYIYNRGNITYSGAGHTDTLSSDEAELFVNTMIAAYRAAYSKPTIEFKTSDDYPASMQLVPVEFESATSSQSLGGVQNIYFKLQDTNLTANKSIAVELYYDVAAGTSGAVVDAALTVPVEGAVAPTVKNATLGKVYRVDTGAEVTATNLSSNTLYQTAIPTEVLTYFAGRADVETKIYLKATTTIHNGSSNSAYSGSDALTLKKLGLLRLE